MKKHQRNQFSDLLQMKKKETLSNDKHSKSAKCQDF